MVKRNSEDRPHWRSLSAPGDEGRETAHLQGGRKDRRTENRIRKMERAASPVVVRKKEEE